MHATVRVIKFVGRFIKAMWKLFLSQEIYNEIPRSKYTFSVY